MRAIATLILTALFVLAADTKPPVTSPVGPVPIPKDRQEDISRAMLHVQQTQMAEVQTRTAAESAAEHYRIMLTALQKEFNAEGCDLDLDKTWRNCPVEKTPAVRPAK
jgi:hypothetical protein